MGIIALGWVLLGVIGWALIVAKTRAEGGAIAKSLDAIMLFICALAGPLVIAFFLGTRNIEVSTKEEDLALLEEIIVGFVETGQQDRADAVTRALTALRYLNLWRPAGWKPPTEEQLKAVAEAIRETDQIGYSIHLTRLIDGVSTYELDYGHGEPVLEFPSHGEALEHVQGRRSTAQAEAVINALAEQKD